MAGMGLAHWLQHFADQLVSALAFAEGFELSGVIELVCIENMIMGRCKTEMPQALQP